MAPGEARDLFGPALQLVVWLAPIRVESPLCVLSERQAQVVVAGLVVGRCGYGAFQEVFCLCVAFLLEEGLTGSCESAAVFGIAG